MPKNGYFACIRDTDQQQAPAPEFPNLHASATPTRGGARPRILVRMHANADHPILHASPLSTGIERHRGMPNPFALATTLPLPGTREGPGAPAVFTYRQGRGLPFLTLEGLGDENIL